MKTRSRKRIAILAALVVCVSIAGFLYLRLLVADHGQCESRCAAQYGPHAHGSRRGWIGETCRCTRDGASLDDVPRRNPAHPPPTPRSIVCGADGRTYSLDRAALPDRAEVLHAGRCGACSNAADIATYRRTAATLTRDAETCALRNTLFGEAVGRSCFAERSGLGPACVDCWIANMNCTAVHCLGVCLRAKLTGEPRTRPDGSLNACLACDEAYCGTAFIECAGANRRRAGITSDISRPAAQMWQPDASVPPSR